MKRYEKYKDSGVDWIDEIPDGWKMLSNKYIFNLKKNLVGKKSSQYELLSLTLKGIIKRDMENPEGKFPAEFDTYQEVKKNDFVFCLFDVEETPRTVGLSNFNGMITGAYTVMEASKKTYSKYLYYFYLNLDEKKRLKFLYKGLRNTIPKDSFFSFKTIVPPLSEQQTIATFLDDKTAKIDQLIQIKQKEINLLKERRQILIQKAVTKGLDPNVKMKDSGVDWIGEIPEHWEVRKLKYIGNMFSGLTNKKGDDFSKEPKEGFSPFIPFTNIFRNNKISENEFQFVKSNPFDVQNVVELNDILFLMSSETFDDIGKNSIYLGKTKVFLNSFCKGFKIYDKNINPLFINYLLLSKSYREYFASVGRGFTRINIKQEYVLDMPILYMPLIEQSKIVSHLEALEEKIAKAIKLKEQETEKLKEYKTVLIDNVVTGKVKVV